jgi:CubicO group peptidase (beta-lactamase class C family)
MSDLQDRVQQEVDALVDSGRETGLQVAVFVGGEQVVDVVAGLADRESGRAVTADTPFYAYSVMKGLVTTAVHVLA